MVPNLTVSNRVKTQLFLVYCVQPNVSKLLLIFPVSVRVSPL